MKGLHLRCGELLCLGILLVVPCLKAQTSSTAAETQSSAGAPAVVSTRVALPYGVADVLKLSLARISDDIIIKYIQNSGTVYNLAPKDIVYLRDEGVSDRVISAMLDQRQNLAQTGQSPAPSGTAASSVPQTDSGYSYPQPAAAPTYAPVYVRQPALSTVFVIPDHSRFSTSYCSPDYYYSNYYPLYYGYSPSPGPYFYFGPRYYGPRFGYWGPHLSFGFRLGF